jgi:hypothetical protein
MPVTLFAPEATMTSLPDIASNLLLARLLAPSKKSPPPSRLRTDLGKLLGRVPTSEQFQEWVDHLRGAGLLTEMGMQLTESGREKALVFLGVEELPPRSTWRSIQARHLIPRALGLPSNAKETQRQLGRQDKLAALLLKLRFKLPVGSDPTLGDVFEALACRELGFPEEKTMAGIQNRVLSRLLGAEGRLTPAQLERQLPRVLLGATKSGVDGLRELLLREWATGHTPDHASPGASTNPVAKTTEIPTEFDLDSFARTVKAVARACPTGRFGDNKVFISHVWRRLADEPAFAGLDLTTFKQRLSEANRADLLNLSRADLVSVMNPVDVQESETRYLNAVFHFILLEEQP